MKDAVVAFLKKIHLFFLYRAYKKIQSRITKIITLRIKCPRAYYKNAKKPIDPNKVVFVEVRLPEITNSFKLLYDKLVSEYNYDVRSHFLKNTFVPLKEYTKRCEEMMADIATAKYVFVNDASNVISCVKMRKETIVTQMWHGCGAFKKFGFSTAELIFGESRREQLRFPFYKNLTHVTVSSPEVGWAYEEAMNLHDTPEAIKPIGISRTDIFYDDKFIEDSYKKLHAFMPSSEGKKVILYAPTFRGRVASGKTPNMLNVRMFKEELGDEYVLLVKHHPFVRKPPVIPESCADFAADMSDAMGIEELLAVSDICISDYSSLVFEYSLYERPLIFFSYDLSEYFDWRGFYYDYNELAPGPIFKTNLEMIDYIKNVDERFDKERIRAFREKFMSSCDGNATVRLMDMVFGKDDLENHKREVALAGEFSDLPDADTLHSVRLSRVNYLKELGKKAEKLYSAYSERDIRKDKILVLSNGKMNATLSTVKKSLEGKAKVTSLNAKTKDLKVLIEAIATSGTIVIGEACDIINVLNIRKGTKVVQLWSKVFPFQKFGYSTRNVLSGLDDDLLSASPLHKNYGLVPVAAESLKNVYSEAFGMKSDEAIKPLGAATTDILFNQDYRKKARAKIDKKFPAATGKKIIFYLQEPRQTLLRPREDVFAPYLCMNEYLSRDYCLVYHWKREDERMMPLELYMNEFMVNMYGEMSIDELMAAADIMVGDYREEIFTFAATGRPIFLYAPDYKTYFFKSDSYFDYEEIAPGPIFTDGTELTKAIADIQNYDATKLNAFRDKYLTNCDGKATERIVESIIE